ncbi:arsenite S-adenosylmethyltransferase, partial [Chloroflexota bacterium]
CLSGALLKDEYLAAVTGAGFDEVKILDETVFPVGNMLNDPTAKVIIDKLNLTEEKVMDTASSVVSIKVQAIKPE